MRFTFNGSPIDSVTFNNADVESVTVNGVEVWEKTIPIKAFSLGSTYPRWSMCAYNTADKIIVFSIDNSLVYIIDKAALTYTTKSIQDFNLNYDSTTFKRQGLTKDGHRVVLSKASNENYTTLNCYKFDPINNVEVLEDTKQLNNQIYTNFSCAGFGESTKVIISVYVFSASNPTPADLYVYDVVDHTLSPLTITGLPNDFTTTRFEIGNSIPTIPTNHCFIQRTGRGDAIVGAISNASQVNSLAYAIPTFENNVLNFNAENNLITSITGDDLTTNYDRRGILISTNNINQIYDSFGGSTVDNSLVGFTTHYNNHTIYVSKKAIVTDPSFTPSSYAFGTYESFIAISGSTDNNYYSFLIV